MAKFVGKYVRDQVLNWYKGTTFPAAPANAYVALYTAAPTAIDGTGGTETSYTGYARQAIAAANWGAVSANGSGLSQLEQITNSAAPTFPNNSGSSVTIVGRGLFDAASGGNFLGYGDLPNSIVIGTGQGYTAPVGDLLNQM